MRRMFLANLAALMSLQPLPLPYNDELQFLRFGISRRGVASKRPKTGKHYPHSSKRQRARYARQIAARQI